MKKFCLFLLFFLAFNWLQAQSVTWAKDIAPIMYENCGACHRDGGAGPFSLTDYQSASSYANLIKWAVQTGHMPPWPPDPNYSHFAFERTLTDAERNAIIDWVDMGVPSGDLSQTPPVPDYPEGAELPGTPSMILQIPTYTVQALNEDEYRCFVIPSNLVQDKFVTSWEIVPGNRSVVHHVLVFQDLSGQCAAADAATPETGYTCFGGACFNAKIIGAWAPGGNPLVYPPGMGVRFKAGSDIIIQMHYPAGTYGQVDSTQIRLYFAPQNTGMREVFFTAVADPWSSNQSGAFIIPANQIKTFNTQFNFNYNYDFSLLRVMPHMHLLGQSMKAWLKDPDGNEVPLIHIPEWDFHWQGMYAYPKPVHIKDGSKLFTQFTYNNTASNPNNPNTPPKLVGYGESTTDEMLFLFVEYVLYQTVDENIVLDSSALTSVQEVSGTAQRSFELGPCQPNPVSDFTQIPFYLPENQRISLQVLDLTGREVAVPLAETAYPAGGHVVSFQQKLSPGIYFMQLVCENGVRKSSKFVVQ